MNKRELIKAIKEGLGIDYRMVSVGAGVVRLAKEVENGTNYIVFPYRKYPGEYILAEYVTGWKSIDSVEKILKKYYKKYNINQLFNTIYTSSRWKKELFKISLRNVEDVQKVIPYLKEMVYEDILPFFERYQTVEQVYEYMESLPKAEVSKFIYHPPVPRMMIIKRLVNAPDWEEFGTWAVDIYKKMTSNSKNKEDIIMYQILMELFEELKNMDV